MSDVLHISYGINEEDKIIFANEAWSEFAIANNAPELAAEKVLNCHLWDFISDDMTRELYTRLFEKVRAGHSVNLNFRCDSPDLRRFFEMDITLREDKNIQFDTRMINIEERVYQKAFQHAAPSANSVLIICSWCKKIKTRDKGWQEIEEALCNLKLFESKNVPQMSHGMCVSCFQSISEKHRDTFESQAT